MDGTMIALLLLGLSAGIFSGMFGIGGGVIIVPVLIIFFQFSAIGAISTSLAALLLPVGALAVGAYYRQGRIDVRSAVMITLGLFMTNIVGAKIALGLDPDMLKQIYGVFLLYMAWRFIEPRKWLGYAQSEKKEDAVQHMGAEGTLIAWYKALGVGLFAGVLSGMFGIGGGAVIVPMLVGFFNYDQKLAVGTSLAALLFPFSLPAVLTYYAEGVLNIGFAAVVAVGLVAGSIVGANIALNLPSATVKRLYGFFLTAVGLWFIVQPLLFPNL